AQPWQNPDVKRQWVDAFNNAAQAQASRLRDLAQQLDASRAGVIEQALHERLQPAPPKMPDKRNGRM
ncbi:MAG: hypothetical protein DI592_21140, partial [Stenotrophomonas maltophilia]